jgi:hypothetical protein
MPNYWYRMLEAAANGLIALIRDEKSSLDDLNRTARSLLQAVKQASPDQRSDSLQSLAGLFR